MTAIGRRHAVAEKRSRAAFPRLEPRFSWNQRRELTGERRSFNPQTSSRLAECLCPPELEWMLAEVGAVETDLEEDPRPKTRDVLLSTLKANYDEANDWDSSSRKKKKRTVAKKDNSLRKAREHLSRSVYNKPASESHSHLIHAGRFCFNRFFAGEGGGEGSFRFRTPDGSSFLLLAVLAFSQANGQYAVFAGISGIVASF
ncbi:hypothetical protein HPB51_013904 [Rhipicephalus microplus]|uniref:Uncharacterized protein n=1 Tax=Rhipicephalus microplus TaxID=6941 RepID=A0A9J6D5D9_RHIMP|nr:hypothetical protein HPB51_013904 [Rhipicephalus microplus]